ncbi:NADPH-dependent oxidoreductase [Enterococcus songbeiensis]|uniref:NADPH-dependent oxidoreductase n=1 Tax=Enterococcus songbeiensis TaxID=2559927 RepID=UPI0010F64040|nr:NADPH-dependent oxidoreductase [Enterococcus songbeiensis]
MDLYTSFMEHTSVRSFQEKKVPDSLKEKLIAAAQSGSSSNFVQAYSIIEVRDPQKLATIESIANCPGYVTGAGVFYVFVADLNRHAQLLAHHQRATAISNLETMEALTVAIVDTTIAAQNMAVFAEGNGLGICYIGGIRNDLFQLAELLDLPKHTVPLFGLSIGYPKIRNQPKKRLPAAEILSVDRYQPVNFDHLQAYDEQTAAYYAKRTTNQQQTSWSKKMLAFFSEPRRLETSEFLKKQGFHW